MADEFEELVSRFIRDAGELLRKRHQVALGATRERRPRTHAPTRGHLKKNQKRSPASLASIKADLLEKVTAKPYYKADDYAEWLNASTAQLTLLFRALVSEGKIVVTSGKGRGTRYEPKVKRPLE